VLKHHSREEENVLARTSGGTILTATTTLMMMAKRSATHRPTKVTEGRTRTRTASRPRAATRRARTTK
ncbi:unnamed protein product, partial [Polarella glacialis]